MMNKEQFITLLVERLKNDLGNGYEVSSDTVTKNNGVILNGIIIGKNQQQCRTIIYIDSLYDDYLNGRCLQSIVDNMIETFYRAETEQNFDVHQEHKLFDRIRCKLINTKANKEFLDKTPHTEFHDLSLIYYYSLDNAEDEYLKSVTIDNAIMKSINLSLDELHRIAMKNTKEQMPGQIIGMSTLLHQMSDGLYPEDEDETMYVITNTKKIFGASAILQEELLSDFCNSINVNSLYIIPSSVHEMILLPCTRATSVNEINRIINEVNSTKVDAQDVLSSNCYIYNRSLHQISVA